MSGRGFGASGARGVCVLLLLLVARESFAQSTASFPEPAPVAPRPVVAPVAPRPVVAPVAPRPVVAPVAPRPVVAPVAPRPVVAPASPVPVAPRAAPAVALPAPAAARDSTTDRRYAVSSTLGAAPPAALGFYPSVLPYRTGLPVPAGYRVEHRAANSLIIGGLTALVVSYGTAVIVGGSESFQNGTGWTVVPVIGPWAAIGARSYHCASQANVATVATANASVTACVRGAFSEVQTIAILSADAVVQAAGAVLLLAGLGSGRDELVRDDLGLGFRLTPRAVGSNGGFGLGIDGRF